MGSATVGSSSISAINLSMSCRKKGLFRTECTPHRWAWRCQESSPISARTVTWQPRSASCHFPWKSVAAVWLRVASSNSRSGFNSGKTPESTSAAFAAHTTVCPSDSNDFRTSKRRFSSSLISTTVTTRIILLTLCLRFGFLTGIAPETAGDAFPGFPLDAYCPA